MRLCDIRAIADIADNYNTLFGVDSSFASPYFQAPLDLDADIVVHSPTKYLNGHSDSVGGAVITDEMESSSNCRWPSGLGLGICSRCLTAIRLHEGYVVVHPSHIDHVNDCFTPNDETVEYWISLYCALRDAIERGESAIRHYGEMIDIANLETAREDFRRVSAFRNELDDDIAARLTALKYSTD